MNTHYSDLLKFNKRALKENCFCQKLVLIINNVKPIIIYVEYGMDCLYKGQLLWSLLCCWLVQSESEDPVGCCARLISKSRVSLLGE
mmetsp:Transcript_14576/g.22984  ORF Transcript_14576/g.22984 Transcript_14576/m.22984 type:complete len:87 (+) Transcript_14576:70-330(+)